ncbi:hypothetical protein HPQ64_02150 [Rhizobiales bacterium]|uniref:hypothetical protein n=1 Tax=Hongsoonwoonella zoysiae TaxID=2821844 RepID=UPI001561731C|nr:hypothetical protein [Hongsoonwoonella zoysiae]NRG16484.1 hypothetical protein [Hongsoonwoonella zoysiae]
MTSPISLNSSFNAYSILTGGTAGGAGGLGKAPSALQLLGGTGDGAFGQGGFDTGAPATDAQAFIFKTVLRKGQELPPAQTDDPQAANHAGNIHSELEVNGKTLVRAFNDGSIEVAPTLNVVLQYEGLTENGAQGPDAAEARVKKIAEYLSEIGIAEESSEPAGTPDNPKIEIVIAETALTQEDYIQAKIDRGEAGPGLLFSGTI